MSDKPITLANCEQYEAHLIANGLGKSFVRPLVAQHKSAMELLERIEKTLGCQTPLKDSTWERDCLICDAAELIRAWKAQ